MTNWVAEELALLKTFWPDLEYEANGHWIFKRDYQVPAGWSRLHADIAIRIPPNLPAEQPYGFWVRGGLSWEESGTPGSYTFPASEPVPFAPGDQWGKFSWQMQDGVWKPGERPGAGTGMIQFAMSINRRLREGQ